MFTRDVDDGNPQPVTGAEMQAEWLLLSDLGYGNCKPGDDEESQQFAAQVRELNPGWQPGTIPRVPNHYRDARRERRDHATAGAGRRPELVAAPRRAATTSRRRPQSRRVARTVGSRGDPPPGDDKPPLRQDFTAAQGPSALQAAFERAEADAWDELGLTSLGEGLA
jgi:hypothetical protein